MGRSSGRVSRTSGRTRSFESSRRLLAVPGTEQIMRYMDFNWVPPAHIYLEVTLVALILGWRLTPEYSPRHRICKILITLPVVWIGLNGFGAFHSVNLIGLGDIGQDQISVGWALVKMLAAALFLGGYWSENVTDFVLNLCLPTHGFWSTGGWESPAMDPKVAEIRRLAKAGQKQKAIRQRAGVKRTQSMAVPVTEPIMARSRQKASRWSAWRFWLLAMFF